MFISDRQWVWNQLLEPGDRLWSYVTVRIRGLGRKCNVISTLSQPIFRQRKLAEIGEFHMLWLIRHNTGISTNSFAVLHEMSFKKYTDKGIAAAYNKVSILFVQHDLNATAELCLRRLETLVRVCSWNLLDCRWNVNSFHIKAQMFISVVLKFFNTLLLYELCKAFKAKCVIR